MSTSSFRLEDKEITLTNIEEAHERIKNYIHETPTLTNETISKMTNIPNCKLYFKCENFNKIGAFKIRGATNAILKTINQKGSDNINSFGVITHSSGNHAQALAKSAQFLGIKATIVMPNNSPIVKVNAVQYTYGAEVHLCEPTIQSRENTCESLINQSKENNEELVFIHPYDNDWIIEGQGTVTKELLEQVTKLNNNSETKEESFPLDCLIAPIGGGGLMSGNAIYFKEKFKQQMNSDSIDNKEEIVAPVMIGVEPECVNDAQQSFEKKQLKQNDIKKVNTTICDGLKTNLSERTFHYILKYVDYIFTVSDEEVKKAMKLVFERMKMVIEPSSATVVALVLFNEKFKELALEKKFKNIGLIISGGNCDLDKLPWL
ncbi:hypothetical protein ABK040_006571 [Willaertia magna]